MKLFVAIVLFPFVLVFSFIKALITAVQAFKLGLQGNIYCKRCGTATHIDNSIFGFCSTECASFDNDVLDTLADEAEDTPEWKILQSPASAKLKDFSVYLDQHGRIYLKDFGDGEPFLKLVGHDGYLLQTAH